MSYYNLHSGPQTVETTETDTLHKHEDVFQVVLYNDDVNEMDHVVMSLMKVFDHTTELAVKITLDAHKNGRAVAEVEAREQAQLHKEQLQSLGLTASVEVIS
jgi:ATP-dependent Clp protease adapter protein ClpS